MSMTPNKPAQRTDPFRVTMMIFAAIGFMYFTGEVLKPLALSVLLSFALAPVANLLERCRLPRAAAVILTVVLSLGVLACSVTWSVGSCLRWPFTYRSIRSISRPRSTT